MGDVPCRDAIVVGAGPAGLAAAATLAGHGADVLLLDEQTAPGGQIYRQVERASPGLRGVLGADYGKGAALVAAFRASGAAYWPRSSVWQVTPDRTVWASRDGTSSAVRAATVILATGAMERPVPVPGWTLPGVMSAGALQILLKTGGLLARDAVLVGSGPLVFLLAAQCIEAGQPPRAVVDTAARGAWRRTLPLLRGILSGAGLATLAKGAALQGTLRASGTAWHRHATGIRIEGDGAATGVSFTAGGVRQFVGASIVALHEGVIPAQQAARSVGCAFAWDAAGHCFQPTLDDWGASSVAGVLIAGDGGGIAGAAAATHAGRIAAFEALRRSGHVDAGRRDSLADADRRALAAERAARPFLDALFAPSPDALRPADEATVCRCEEVTAGAIRAVARQECLGPNQAKAFLRVGMGACQGRICGPLVSTLMAETRGVGPDEVGYFRVRPPLKPVTVGELAAASA